MALKIVNSTLTNTSIAIMQESKSEDQRKTSIFEVLHRRRTCEMLKGFFFFFPFSVS